MVIFFVSSGSKIGIGHVRRCTQIALNLGRKNIDFLFCLNYDVGSLELIKPYGFNIRIISEEFGVRDIIKENPKVKVVIYDLLNINKEDNLFLKQNYPGIRILALDYFDMTDSQVDTIINLYNHSRTFSKPVSSDVKYLEGPKFGILRDEFKQFINRPIFLKNASLRRILITFGGSDPQFNTLFVLPILNNLEFADKLEVGVVLGPNFSHADQILELINNMTLKVEPVRNPSDMAALMSKADLCLCGSGTTILELAALGVPGIVLPQSEEEFNFAKSLEAAGFAQVVGYQKSRDASYLEQTIRDFYENPKKLKEIGERGRELCNGLGDQAIVEEIIELMNS